MIARKDCRSSGARAHNLKNIDVTIPRDQFVVITGLSGSGKSSLAFDTIYAEGQRRYVESLSAYARQFLGQMDKPDVDGIDGLSPAISIDQKTTSRNPRSTVGTVTEIYDYLRLLFARVGHALLSGAWNRDYIANRSANGGPDHGIAGAFPDSGFGTGRQRAKRGACQAFKRYQRQGYVRVRIDGELRDLSEEIKLEKNKKHTIEVVVDRIIVKPGVNTRLTDSVETALAISDGEVLVDVIGGEELLFSPSWLVRSAASALRNCLRACFLLTARTALVRLVTDWETGW